MATPTQVSIDLSGIPSLPSTLHIPSVAGTLGAVLIGTFLGLILYGLTLHQAYHYARTFPRDPSWLKGVVMVTVQAIFHFGADLGNRFKRIYYAHVFSERSKSLNLFYSFSGATMVTAQSFFARRLWILGGRIYRIVVVLSASNKPCISSLAQLAATTITFVTSDADNVVALRLLPSAFTLAMVSDLLLTASLIHVLHCKRTGFKRTDTVIDTLILYSINTGLLNGVFDLITAILAFAQPDKHLYSVFGIPGVKLYAITLLAALNSRRTIQAQSATVDSELHGSDLAFGVSVSPPPTTKPMSLGARLRGHRASSVGTSGGNHALIELKNMSSSRPSRGTSVEERADRVGSDQDSYHPSAKTDDVESAHIDSPVGW
ncbi:uncharacterized protein TRAVEDRAFT_52676 [Trametes versicolor FP-101664 SS1]|uniref:uncharacterized protein n=1 Tax=Trametes versicolor (strain FP-101664) TaxID=717944 RepID=UPI0004623282|nr:uncharacterized protein TRAVEDRAFT_52676 [Trametes versicolor FP-101664 SS1]EIW53550.1 hypothetical protein TRAVEDRAFT_52676 [Trametes versicolor FP-101664 SS1]